MRNTIIHTLIALLAASTLLLIGTQAHSQTGPLSGSFTGPDPYGTGDVQWQVNANKDGTVSLITLENNVFFYKMTVRYAGHGRWALVSTYYRHISSDGNSSSWEEKVYGGEKLLKWRKEHGIISANFTRYRECTKGGEQWYCQNKDGEIIGTYGHDQINDEPDPWALDLLGALREANVSPPPAPALLEEATDEGDD